MLRNDKRGFGNQLVLILVMAGIIILLVLGLFVFQLVGPPLTSTMQDATGTLRDTFQQSNNEELINASQSTIVPASQTLNNMEWISYTIFTLMVLAWVVMCFYVRSYPFLLVLWVVLVIVIVSLSIYLTVVYQDMRVSPGLSEYYQSWENTDFMLKNLPIVMTILGIGGGVVMFVLASRDQEAETGGGYL